MGGRSAWWTIPRWSRRPASSPAAPRKAPCELFDAVLPDCDRMVDFGAYVGFTALYAATYVPRVFAFEASPTSFSLLRANLALNPALRSRVALFPHAVGDRDAEVTLYGRGYADPGLLDLPRRPAWHRGHRRPGGEGADARRATRCWPSAASGRAPCSRSTSRARNTSSCRPSPGCWPRPSPCCICPFTRSTSWSGRTSTRTRWPASPAAMRVAEALTCYRYMSCHTNDCWIRVDPADRLDFLRRYLLRPKQLRGIGSPRNTASRIRSRSPMRSWISPDIDKRHGGCQRPRARIRAIRRLSSRCLLGKALGDTIASSPSDPRAESHVARASSRAAT